MQDLSLIIGVVGGLIGIVGALFGILFGGAGLLVTMLGWDGVIPTVRRWLARRQQARQDERREQVLTHIRSVLSHMGPGGPGGLSLHEFEGADRQCVLDLCSDGLLVLHEGVVFIPERAPRSLSLVG